MVDSDTLLLMQLYWRLDRRADGGIGRAAWARRVFVGLIIVVFSATMGFVTGVIVQDGVLGATRPDVVPGLLLTLVLVGTAFAGFNQALQALYLSDDLERLLVAPVRARAVVTAKLLGRLPTIMFFLFGLAAPALVAFGIVLGLGPFYYLVGVLLLLVAPLFGISVGAIVAIYLVRILPARRLSDWVGAASIILGTVLSMLAYLPQILRGRNREMSAEAGAAIADALNGFSNVPLPSTWAGRALVDLGEYRLSAPGAGGLLGYLLITVGLFAATMFVADRLYLSGWLRMQSAGARTRGLNDAAGLFGGGSLDLILGYKDWLLRVRDARLMAAMFSGLLVTGIMVLFIFRPGADNSILNFAGAFRERGLLSAVFSRGVMLSGIVYFVAWSSVSRIASSALSIERGAVYILKSAPISPTRIMRAKVFGVLAPYTLFVTLLLVAAAVFFDVSVLWLPYAWLVLLITGFGLISYAVSLDFVFPRLDWEDPRRMTNRKAALPLLLGWLLYSVAALPLALGAYVLGVATPVPAVVAVLLGLGLLAGGTWFFVSWRVQRVEAVWPMLGEA